jgi:hypothetical protein
LGLVVVQVLNSFPTKSVLIFSKSFVYGEVRVLKETRSVLLSYLIAFFKEFEFILSQFLDLNLVFLYLLILLSVPLLVILSLGILFSLSDLPQTVGLFLSCLLLFLLSLLLSCFLLDSLKLLFHLSLLSFFLLQL